MRRFVLTLLVVFALPAVAFGAVPQPDGRWYGGRVVTVGATQTADIRSEPAPAQRYGTVVTAGDGALYRDGHWTSTSVNNSINGSSHWYGQTLRALFEAPVSATTTHVVYSGRFAYQTANGALPDYSTYVVNDDHSVELPSFAGLPLVTVAHSSEYVPGTAYAQSSNPVVVGNPNGSWTSGSTTTFDMGTSGGTALRPSSAAGMDVEFIYDLSRENTSSAVWTVRQVVGAAGWGVTQGTAGYSKTVTYTASAASFVPVPAGDEAPMLKATPNADSASITRTVVVNVGASIDNAPIITSGHQVVTEFYSVSEAVAAANGAAPATPTPEPYPGYELISPESDWQDQNPSNETSTPAVPGEFAIPQYAKDWGSSVASSVAGWLSPITDMFWPLDVLKGIQ